jgi:hypothetical protein
MNIRSSSLNDNLYSFTHAEKFKIQRNFFSSSSQLLTMTNKKKVLWQAKHIAHIIHVCLFLAYSFPCLLFFSSLLIDLLYRAFISSHQSRMYVSEAIFQTEKNLRHKTSTRETENIAKHLNVTEKSRKKKK